MKLPPALLGILIFKIKKEEKNKAPYATSIDLIGFLITHFSMVWRNAEVDLGVEMSLAHQSPHPSNHLDLFLA